MTVNRIAICVKEGEDDGVTVVGVVPRGHVLPPYLPLGLAVPASVAFSDCVAIAARVHCDGRVVSLGPPRDLPSVKTPPAPRRLDGQALKDAIALYGPFKSELTQEYLALFGVRLLDRPYLMCVSAADKTLELPFGHSIYRVNRIDWVAVTPANFVSISAPQQDNSVKRPQINKKDINRLQHFLGYDWGEADSLLFADGINVCSVFPFNSPTSIPSSTSSSSQQQQQQHKNVDINTNWTESQRHDEFGCDWGKSLRQPFDDGNIGQLCSPFTRGFALGTIFTVAPPNRTASMMKQNPEPLLSSSQNNNNDNNSSQQQHTPKQQTQSPQNQEQHQQQEPINATGAPNENVLFFFMMGTQHSGNPGPRFFGRGLNEQGHCGNDLVYQLVAWKYRKQTLENNSSSPLQYTWDVQWTRHRFLRGTAPIKFKNQVATGIGEAKIIILDDALDGSAEYLERQVEKCNVIANFPASSPSTSTQQQQQQNTPSPAAAVASSTTVGNMNEETTTTTSNPKYASYPKLRCINLLKSVSQAGEHRLGALFDQSVKRLASSTGIPIDIEHIDWLGLEAKFGIETAALKIWNCALMFMDGGGQETKSVSAGSFPLRARLPKSPEESRDLASPSLHTITQQQNRFVRYNCADSLDRTNLASFFVVAQLCSRLFLTLDVVPDRLRLHASANPMLYETAPVPKANPDQPKNLKELEELKEDLDELQEMPPESELPPCFYHSIKDFAESMPEPLLQALVEIFVTNGDTIAKLFTSTGAIHTSHMRKFVPGMRSATANAILSAQRRFENVFRDKRKYRVVDIIVGKDTKTYHFPSIPQHYLVWPLPRKQWPNALVIKIPAINFLIGRENLRKALFPDDEEKQNKLIDVREEILAVEKVVDPNAVLAPPNSSANLLLSNSATSPHVLSPPMTPQPSSRKEGINNSYVATNVQNTQPQGVAPNSPHSSNSSTTTKNQQQQQAPPSSVPAVPASSPLLLDDDVPRDQENADFSFLTFDRFYLAVVLFEPNSQLPSSIINLNPLAKDLPLNEKRVVLPLKVERLNNVTNEIPYQVQATCSYYLYEQATEETTGCLRVRKATQEANAASPLVKLSNFAKSLFK